MSLTAELAVNVINIRRDLFTQSFTVSPRIAEEGMASLLQREAQWHDLQATRQGKLVTGLEVERPANPNDKLDYLRRCVGYG